MAKVDTVIIGAGPIGLEVAAALKKAGVDLLHLDAGQIGATLRWWAPGTRFFSSPERIEIAGVPLTTPEQDKATREQYLAYLSSVIERLNLSVRTFERVERIERIERASASDNDERFMLSTRSVTGKHEHRCRHLVLAIGNMHRPRLLDIPGEDLPNVSHYLAEPSTYFHNDLLIVGGKNSAVEAAIRCSRAGARVTISYRRENFDSHRVKRWLAPEIKWLIQHGRIRFLPRTAPISISARAVTLQSTDDEGSPISGTEHAINADFVLLLTGYVQDSSLFKQLGVTLIGDSQAPLFDEQTMQTDVPGVYVAGTATAGSQRRARVFIETSHDHAPRIAASITGAPLEIQSVNKGASDEPET